MWLAHERAHAWRGGRAPRTYGSALLTALTTASLPVGRTMQAISPIKERILHLQDHVDSRRARIAIAVALAGFAFAAAGSGQ